MADIREIDLLEIKNPIWLRGIDSKCNSGNILVSSLLKDVLLNRSFITSLENTIKTGIYMNLNTAIDYPGSNPYGMLLVFESDGMIVQFYINTSSLFFMRQYSSGYWCEWKTIAFV